MLLCGMPVANVPGFVFPIDKPSGLKNWFEPLTQKTSDCDLYSILAVIKAKKQTTPIEVNFKAVPIWKMVSLFYSLIVSDFVFSVEYEEQDQAREVCALLMHSSHSLQ